MYREKELGRKFQTTLCHLVTDVEVMVRWDPPRNLSNVITTCLASGGGNSDVKHSKKQKQKADTLQLYDQKRHGLTGEDDHAY